MSKGDTYEGDLLKLLLNATTIDNIAMNATTSPITSIWVSLHTADPTDAGDQTSSEVSYTGYARVGVTRATTGWTITGNSASPVSAIAFGQQSSTGTSTVTHFGVGTASTGAGKLLYKGTVTPNISMAQNVTPSLATTSTITED